MRVTDACFACAPARDIAHVRRGGLEYPISGYAQLGAIGQELPGLTRESWHLLTSELVSRASHGTYILHMAKAKKTKPREHMFRWRVSLIKGTPAKFIDFAIAPDAETAEKQVAEEHRIPDTLRDRLVAIREEL